MSDFELPTTRYALSGEVNIAYQVMGDGPVDLIIVPGIVSHVEFLHEFPEYTPFLRRLASFARVITFDKRGQGLSDAMTGAATLEQRVDVLEGVGRVVQRGGDGRLGPELHRRVQQRDPMVLVVEGQERQGGVLVHHVSVENGAVPVAHRLVLGGLEDVMSELGLGHPGHLVGL